MIAALLCAVSAAQVLVPLDQGGTPAQTQRPSPTADPGKYIVKFAPGTSRTARSEAAIQSGATVRINYQTLDAIAITVPNVNALNGLRNNPNVLGIYTDYKFSAGAKPVAPPAPANLSATAASDSQINLAWNEGAGSNESNFEIERCSGAGCSNFTPRATVGANVFAFADTGLAANTFYNYRVRACITQGPAPCSAYSNISGATTLAATPPNAPSGLSASPISPTQVDLSWVDNSGNEQGFRIFRCTGAGCTPTVQLVQLATPNLTAYSDTNAVANTIHRYHVVAYNMAGNSSPSNTDDATTPPDSTAPNAPSSLAITSVSSSAIGMSWADNSTDETGFEIVRCTGASCGGFNFLASVGAGVTSYLDSAVADATTYGYRVRAAKSGEFSGYSNAAEGTTSPIASPPPAETPITGGTRQRVPAGVQRVGPPGLLEDGTPSDGAGIGIAVLDSGLDYAHEDLGLDPEAIGDNSYNGFNPALSAQDDRGHGTHVAGIIAARNNNIGVVGVAPNATLYGVKVLSVDGSGDESNVTAGLDWVIANHNVVTPPIRVLNMSLGRVLGAGETVTDSTPFHVAIQALYNLGIVVVASAGNDPALETTQQIPSGYMEVFAVAGSVADPGQNGCPEELTGPLPVVPADGAAIFTSDGAYVPGVGGVTTSAPSEERDDWLLGPGIFGPTCFAAINGIQSTSLGGGISRLLPLPEGASEGAGTSFAAPHVSGVVARIIQTGVVSPVPPADATDVEAIRAYVRNAADRREVNPPDPMGPPPAPLDNPLDLSLAGVAPYTFDGEREGIAQAPR